MIEADIKDITWLSEKEVQKNLEKYGYNSLPKAKATNFFILFLKQFLNPLVYILLLAAVFSFFLGEIPGAIFIIIALLVNASIGSFQEYSSQQASISLQTTITEYATVIRNAEKQKIDVKYIVPGDIVILESGDKVPADIELIRTQNLTIDESLLTGESLPVSKEVKNKKSAHGNIAYSNSFVMRGRGVGKVIATGLNTKIGHIAKTLIKKIFIKPPLLRKLETLTNYISLTVLSFVIIIPFVVWLQGGNIIKAFILVTALAVAAIPEGLPAAITIALAIGIHRMSKRNVIVRKLLAVESLGSCTFIASDKTGTLTENKLTIKHILLPDDTDCLVTGEGIDTKGKVLLSDETHNNQVKELCTAGFLVNEARREGKKFVGDMVDVAFLVLMKKAETIKNFTPSEYKSIKSFPYESDQAYSAGLYKYKKESIVFVKGSPERVLEMCSKMYVKNEFVSIDKKRILSQVKCLAEQGHKVLAIAKGYSKGKKVEFKNLTLLGLVGIIDPLRLGVKETIKKVYSAGIDVAMVTGDYSNTALAIAKNLGMNADKAQLITGKEFADISRHKGKLSASILDKRIFSQIEPIQKQEIVEALTEAGHFVAVTGDGVNDAPALKYAHVGVAMGEGGTDIARESADIIITDNKFTSIVNGILEGRVIYNNIRKIVFLLISTGIAEVILFILSLLLNQPVPLVAVQLLWLNLVTNSIQDVALAFEPPEGNELDSPPRSPNESIFNKLMIGRVVTTGFFMGVNAFLVFFLCLRFGYNIEEARNVTLLLMVLFENMQALNSKSETRSVFSTNMLNNSFLFFGIIVVQLIHIISMHIPIIQKVLHVSPVSFYEWIVMLLIAFSLVIVEYLFQKTYTYWKQKY
jgi:P-type Ca2+ transporter type 2C